MRAKKSWAQLSHGQRRMVLAAAFAQVALQLAALRDLRGRTRAQVNGPRWAWTCATFVNTLGPAAYFVWGRRGRTAEQCRPATPVDRP
jgi:Phospholipase_D-nuclease N-terminal